MRYEKCQVVRIYDEMERRITLMISQGEIENENELSEARVLMRQGAYAALMATADNWEDVVRWIEEAER